MQKILLLEPDYRNKFPPVGLMKLAGYHHGKGDVVVFSKGMVKPPSPEVAARIERAKYCADTYGGNLQRHINDMQAAIVGGLWDRVYVTTLFTFEWARTIRLIDYAVSLTGDKSKVFVGGIAASLMPEEFERETGIRPMCGLLASSAMIGYDDNVNIDMLTPDYSILEHIEYRYPFEDGYFLTATRGCGMRCSFCAVQTLEPDYTDYIPITPRIDEIARLYGEKKNLYLLDNNVLKSRAFPQIIEDIKAAGFYRGATIINPKTGKPNLRHIDFNQGLDMNFINEERAKLLSEIALSPVHLAYDHIDDTGKYTKALALLEKYDLTDVCSYLLYNTPDFSGKGSARRADSPEDLYNRVKINVDFTTKVNANRTAGKKYFGAFSFPMKYMPLSSKDRTYIGENWNRKLLSGLRDMVGVRHGGFLASYDGFIEMVGATYSEFYRNLLMPNEYIKSRVRGTVELAPNNPRYFWRAAREDWIARYEALAPLEKAEFEDVISDAIYEPEKVRLFSSRRGRELFYHYFFNHRLLKLLEYAVRNPDVLAEVRKLVAACPEALNAAFLSLLERKDGELLVGRTVALILCGRCEAA